MGRRVWGCPGIELAGASEVGGLLGGVGYGRPGIQLGALDFASRFQVCIS